MSEQDTIMAKSPAGGEIRDVDFSKALSERYLSYAMSTITSRSLPDVRDGLKPVQRRLLYAMSLLKLDPKSGYKKCARVIGDVMGKYHPHGDQAIYDTLVRLAQDFSSRYPLVDGQGNFGNIDGDNAAAMRYTESKLTPVAMALLKGIEDNAVDFKDTYDEEDSEPYVLPAAFPNLLANGSMGIAVGMATNIPPHNAGELCDGLLHLLKHPECAVASLTKHIPGPDLPTGGIIVETHSSILKTYETGRGSIRIRARWEEEKLKAGTYQIVITEIPYQVQKSKLIERIAELLNQKKLPLLNNVMDESAEEIRIVLEPKSRNVDPVLLMETLYKRTDLETRLNLNLNVLDKNGAPNVMSLKEILAAFLEHRFEVLVRRSEFRLSKINHRLELLEGLLIAFLNLDEIIRIIREEDEPKAIMMQKFKLTDLQAEAILNTRLRALRKLEEEKIRGEHADLSAEKADLEALLGSEDKQRDAIAGEIREIRKEFGVKTELGKRLTDFAEAPDVGDISEVDVLPKEPITVLCSKQGWIRAIKGHVDLTQEHKHKEGDEGRFAFHALTSDQILIFSTEGKFFTLIGDKLQRGKGFGEPVRMLFGLGDGEDILSIHIYKPELELIVASSDARGFRVDAKDVTAQTKNGRQVLNLDKNASAKACVPIEGDTVAIIGENRKLIIFEVSALPKMTRGKGVRLQKYKGGSLSDITTLNLADGLSWQTGSRTRTEKDLQPWCAHRGTTGRMAPMGFPRDHKFQKIAKE